MRSKRVFFFDEEREAKETILYGFPGGKIDYNRMYLVAKYFRQSLNYGAVRLEKEIISFCQKQDKNFNAIVEAEAVKKWVNSAMAYDLRKIDSVSITKWEIDSLRQVPNARDRKILFVILVFSKALKQGNTRRDKSKLKVSTNYYIRYSNFQDIIRLSKVSNLTEIGLSNLLYNYASFFTFYNPEKELIRLEYVDNSPQQDFVIYELEDVASSYEIFFGKNIVSCENCGQTFSRTNGNQRYCHTCSSEIRAKRKRNEKRILRDTPAENYRIKDA